MLVPVLAAGLVAGHFQAGSAQDLSFKRSYKANEVDVYALTLTPPGDHMQADIEFTVKSLEGDGATVDYKVLRGSSSHGPMPDPLPSSTSKIGPEAMPNDISPKNGQAFLFALLSTAWITPAAKEVANKPFLVHWQNTAKDLTLDGEGTITSVDQSQKTMTVSWSLGMKPGDAATGEIKVTSVYSTQDYSLKTSRGSVSLMGGSIGFELVKAEAK
jgi:hypothetical protein